MLFITNRKFKQGNKTSPGRILEFDLDDTESSASVHFCSHVPGHWYFETGVSQFLHQISRSPYKQILLYIHGFNILPVSGIFDHAETLQELFDEAEKDSILVVPVIWPTDKDTGIQFDYYDNRMSAFASGIAFARAIKKLKALRIKKKISVLAHSMGNRVLEQTLKTWDEFYGIKGETIFENSFLVAADISHESLSIFKDGYSIIQYSKNYNVYFSETDLALIASTKLNKIRRLGNTISPGGIDCSSFNDKYDPFLGHTFFMLNQHGEPGECFKDIWEKLMPVKTSALGQMGDTL
jgi:Alpha/beta hydrolase of unknown function (DUF900)